MLEQIDDYLDSYAPELQAIICTLREIARKSMPEANLARDGLHILAMTLTDTLSPRSIGKIFLSSAQIVVVSGFF